jgi:hypothetical protein
MIIEGTQNENQRNDEWFKSRMGRFSCSQLHRLMTEPKSKADKEAGKLSEGANTYIMECIAEKITGLPAKEDFTSKYTEWGIENEPIAIGIYDELQKVKVNQQGYIPYGENFGGSPDGLIEATGGVEIKCPYTITNHLNHILSADLKKDCKEYYWQMIGYLLITGREWWDFVSYHPHYPGKYQFHRKRIIAADLQEDIQLAEAKLNQATKQLNLILNSI